MTDQAVLRGDPSEGAHDSKPPGRAVRAGAWWAFGTQLAVQGLSVLATLVLARLLLPNDFGIIAICSSIIGLVSIGLALGWEPSVVRRPHLDDGFLSTLFWMATALGLVATLGTIAAAPALTSALGLPEARPYVQVLALTLVPHLSRTVPTGMLVRAFRYRLHYTIQAAGMVMYVTFQIVLAALGAGVWSVVVGLLAHNIFLAVSAFWAASWRPRWILQPTLLRGEVGFATGNLSSQLATYGVKNVDYWIVGGTLGAASLGAYYMAYVLPSILRIRLTQVAQSVLLPVFARSDDILRRRHIYREVVRLQVGLGFPAMITIAVLSEPIVDLFFGDQWGAVVRPLSWLAIVALLDIPGAILAPVATVCGGLSRLVFVQMIRLFVTVAAVAVAANVWETIESVAIAVLIGALVGAVAQQVVVAAHVQVGFGTVARDVGAVSVSGVAMATAMLVYSHATPGFPVVVSIPATAAIGGAVYLSFGWVVFRGTFRSLLQSAVKMIRLQ